MSESEGINAIRRKEAERNERIWLAVLCLFWGFMAGIATASILLDAYRDSFCGK